MKKLEQSSPVGSQFRSSDLQGTELDNTLMPDGQRILWGFAGIISKDPDE